MGNLSHVFSWQAPAQEERAIIAGDKKYFTLPPSALPAGARRVVKTACRDDTARLSLLGVKCRSDARFLQRFVRKGASMNRDTLGSPRAG
jgi:hypothetical protein